jgi:STE24 endopeptidase
MNGYVLAVLGAVFLCFAITGLARLLNVRSLGQGLPEEFQGVFGEDEYRRSGEYMRAGARLEWTREAVELLALAAFVLAGGLGWLDGLARGLGYGELYTGLVFIGALVLAQSALELPFDAYAVFAVEERFGFNRVTPGLFILDRLKGLALMLVLGGILLGVVLWAFQALGALAWLAAWATVAAFTALMLFLGPRYILPLFNRFTPLEEGELRRALDEYATAHGFTLSGIFVMDGSKRSAKANAFFTGFGRTRRISLYDTLIGRMDTREVVAVLAHEMGHARLNHIGKGFALAMLKTGLTLALLQLFLSWPAIQEAFGVAAPSVHAGLALFGLAYRPVSLALGVSANAWSRRCEFQADAYASDGPGGPAALASALKKLSLANLSNLTPHPLAVWLEYSHPPVIERVRRLMKARS